MARVVELDVMGVEQEVSNMQDRQVSIFPEAIGDLYFILLVQRAIQAYLDNQADLRLALILTNLIVELQKYTSVDYQQLVNARLNVAICETGQDILPGSSQNTLDGNPFFLDSSRVLSTNDRGIDINSLHSSLASHDISLSSTVRDYPYSKQQGRTLERSLASRQQVGGVRLSYESIISIFLASHAAVSPGPIVTFFSLGNNYGRETAFRAPAAEPVAAIRQARLMRELGAFRAPRVMAEEGNVPNEQAKQRRLSR